jgi:glycosyltransferase involved in cell wall biosynthesis
MTSLRILLVMVEPPLPFGNAAGRGYYVLLKGLAERGHQVTAFAACTNPTDIDEARRVFPPTAYDLRCFPAPRRRGGAAKLATLRRPYAYTFGPDLLSSLHAEAARGFDVLHLEQLWSGWVGLPWADRAVLNVHYLYEVDLGSSTDWRRRWSRDRWLARRATRCLVPRYPTITTLTPRLAREVQRLHPAADVRAIPLGLDTDLYPFEAPRSRRQGAVVSLIGSFTWLPTYSAGLRLLRLWPEILRRVPGARLELVGRGAGVLLDHGANAPGIAVHDTVDDVLPYFAAAAVLLYAPARASGMKVKVLEAFALGVPVVTTSEGIEGLPARDGIEAGVADDDPGLIERTVALLLDVDRAERQRQAARALVETHCRPDAIVDAFEEVYRGVVRGDVATAVRAGAIGLAL